MASHVLPQALYFISRSPTCFHAKNLGFQYSRLSVFSVPSFSVGFKFDSPVVLPSKQRFILKAEVISGADSGELDDAQVIETVATDIVDVVQETEDDVKLEVAAKPPRKTRVKLGDIMGILNTRAIEASDKIRPIPDLRSGDIVQIKLEVPENKRRLSIYKGIVISKQNAGIHTTIRVRRIIAGVGIEIVFPVYSPNVKEIMVVRHRKVRRARLYYLRDKLPRFSTFK